MKKSVIAALFAVLSISLASCNNASTNSPSSQASGTSSSSGQGTSSQGGMIEVTETLGSIEVSGDKTVGSKVSFVAKDANGATMIDQTGVSYSVSAGLDLVTLSGREATLLAAGDVTIKGTYQGVEKEVSFTIIGQQLEASISIREAKSKAEGESVVVKGKVLSAVGRSAYIADETGGAYIYNWNYNSDGSDSAFTNSTWTVGDNVIVKSNISSFNGAVQLSNYSNGRIDGTYARKIQEAITPLAPVAIDEAALKALKPTDSGNLYSFTASYKSGTVTAGQNSFLTFTLGATDITLKTDQYDKNPLSQPAFTAGATYKITAPLSWYNGAQFAYVSDAAVIEAEPIVGLSVTYQEKTEVGTTLTLNASVDGITLSAEEQAKVTYTATTGADLVTIAANKVTLNKAGTVTIKASYTTAENKALTYDLSFTVTEPLSQTAIKDITQNATYLVKGQVVGKNRNGFLVSDGDGTIFVYQGSNPSVAVNVKDYVSVQGPVVDYNNAKQFSGSTVTVETSGTAVTHTVTALTKAIADSFLNKTFATTDVKLYSWTATAGKQGTYDTLNFEGSTTVIEPSGVDTSAFTITEGKKYSVEAYVTGYDTTNTYASVLLTKLEEIQERGIDVTIDKATLKAGDATDFAQITVTPTGGYTLDAKTTYTSSDTSIATVDETGKVLGIKASATPVDITVTNGEFTKTVSVTVIDPNAPTTTTTVEFNADFNKDFTTIDKDTVDKTFADGVKFVQKRNTGSNIPVQNGALQNISPIRIYKNHSITFTAPTGKTFSEISFTTISGSSTTNKFNATNVSSDQATIGEDGSVVLTAPVASITFTALNQFHINSVTYTIG